MSTEFDDRDRESVTRDLNDRDDEVRRLAVERVEVLPAAEAIPHLIESLGDSSWRVRKAAIERLVACSNSDRAVESLVGALGDGENTGRRNAAVDALIHFAGRAMPGLLEALTSEDADVRKLVVDAFAGIADSRAREPLLELLEDPDPNVRAASADALGVIGGGDVPQTLLRKVTDESEEQLVRFSAIHAMAALELPVVASELGSVLDDSMLGPAGLTLLGRAEGDEDSIAKLLKALSSSSRSSREASIQSLLQIVGRTDPDLTENLVERIRSAAEATECTVSSAVDHLPEADLSMQMALIQFLGIASASSAVVPMLLAGRDEALSHLVLGTLEAMGNVAEKVIDAEWSTLDSESRRDACVLFGRTDGDAGETRLLSGLEESSVEVRTAAARSIGSRKLASGLAPLVRRLVSAAADDDFESEEELVALTEGLVSLAKPESGSASALTQRAIELLTACLEGANESVRFAVATVVGRVGRPGDSQVVSFLLKDPSAAVRRASVEALARLTPGAASEPLRLALADESPLVRIAAARALGASESDRVVDDLKRLADDEDAQVRAAAVRSLISRFSRSDDVDGRSEAKAAVAAALEDGAVVILAALEALCEVGGREAERALEILTRPEPELVREAIRCVGLHSDDAGVESLVPLVSHADWTVRAEAIQTLADRGLVTGIPAILRRLDTEQDDFVRGVTLRALKHLESGVG
jgi:HEAT repeat protein